MNKYELLGNDEDVDIATKLIDKALKACAKKIKAIDKKYSRVGLGDTSTDETITDELYLLIH